MIFDKIFSNIIFKNFSYLTLGAVISQLLSLITILKITSILETVDYGLFTFLIAQGMLLLRIGDLGNRNIVIRTIARNPESANDMLVNGAIIRALALTILFGIYIVYNNFLGHLSGESLFLIFAFSLINSFSNLLELIFHGNQKMLPSALVNLSYSVLWFIIVFFLIDRGAEVDVIFMFYIGISCLKAILLFFFLKNQKLLVGKVQSFMRSSRQLVKESWPYFVMILILLPLTSLSNNFLDINSTTDQIGYFNLAQRLIGPISLVVGMSLSALFPNLSSLWSKDRKKFHQFLSKGFGLFMIVSMVICFLFTVFSKEVVTLLFPTRYTPAIEVCQMQIWYLFLTSVDSLIGVVLGAANKEKLILRFSIIYFLICTPSLFYGSYYGALGLAYGYVFSYGICLIYVWRTFKKSLNIKIKYDQIVWLLAAALFIISYFLSVDAGTLLKVGICMTIVTGICVYTYKIYKPLLAK